MQAWRWALAFLVFGGLGALLVFGAGLLGAGHQEAARHWMAAARGPWGLPAAVATFAVLAFLGAPQFVLIAAAVLVFGPWIGMAYSWVGTLASATVGYGLGRLFGPTLLAGMDEGAARRLAATLARNGFVASLVVRLVPFAPFVLVNLAAGVGAIGAVDFIAGTALGILPKIALVGLAGRLGGALTHGAAGAYLALEAFVLLAWIGAIIVARRWLRR